MFYHLLYIDPSSGSLIFQGILSLIVSSALFFKQIKFRISQFIKWISQADSPKN